MHLIPYTYYGTCGGFCLVDGVAFCTILEDELFDFSRLYVIVYDKAGRRCKIRSRQRSVAHASKMYSMLLVTNLQVQKDFRHYCKQFILKGHFYEPLESVLCSLN